MRLLKALWAFLFLCSAGGMIVGLVVVIFSLGRVYEPILYSGVTFVLLLAILAAVNTYQGSDDDEDGTTIARHPDPSPVPWPAEEDIPS